MKSKKLLVIAPAFPDRFDKDIDGIFIKDQLKYIKKYFSEIYVIAPNTIWSNSIFGKKRANYTWDNVHVYYPLIANLPSPYVPSILKRLWLQREANEVSRLIESEKISFDLIHAHYTWYPGAMALELKEKFDTPIVITEHTSMTLRKALKKKDPYFINTWKNCDVILSGNQKNALEIAVFNKNSIYVPNGFDEDIIYPQDKKECRKILNIDKNIDVILSIGSLLEVKGHKYLIAAIKEIAENGKDVLCLIGGSGPMRDKLINMIQDFDLSTNVVLMGQVSHKDISILINASDIFVLPSLSESFGIVQIEAMACGKPVVATINGGSEEIITSEQYGYLVEPGNEKQLAEKIIKALDKDWDEEVIREYASGFTWEKIAKKMISIYQNLGEKI